MHPRIYPDDRAAVHDYRIPSDNRLCVKNGTPVRCPNRDIRFPMVWEVDNHPKSHSRFVKKIWVILMDTSKEARHASSIFEASLKTPLGPDECMKDYGMHLSGLLNTC